MASGGERGNIKGAVLVSRMKLLGDQGGSSLVDRVLETLPAEDRESLRAILLPASWYPFELSERLDAAIVAELGGEDETYLALGRQSATDNLAMAHRNYARHKDPHALFRQAASIYRVYYDTGTRSYERLGPKKVRIRTVGSRSFSRGDCLTVVGYFERATEILGGRNVRVDEPACRARLDDHCEYVVEWD